MSSKTKFFTHTDLDGVSCALVAYQAYGRQNVHVTYCDYDNVNQKIYKFINGDISNYDKIFITDISVNEELAGLLDGLHQQGIIEVVLLDHHDVEWLNVYQWALVLHKHSDGRPTSGTTMLFEYLFNNGGFSHMTPKEISAFSEYTERVREYDTWEWKETGDEEPNNFNKLFYFYGRDRWLKKVHHSVSAHGSFFLSQDDMSILSILDEQVDTYIGKMADNLMSFCVGKYQVGVVFGEQHISEVGNELHEMYPSLDLIAIINMKSRKVSYRTIREDIDAGKFARYFGGGGRQATAGSELSEDQIINIVRTILPQ